eukprot:GGOE01010129.1.p3 GENE.GGOE01010129.1~~GGOE01010129.1.p3  ORF type:complete len:129 (+),score=5.63 GGOE01010129.1:292-678(+)
MALRNGGWGKGCITVHHHWVGDGSPGSPLAPEHRFRTMGGGGKGTENAGVEGKGKTFRCLVGGWGQNPIASRKLDHCASGLPAFVVVPHVAVFEAEAGVDGWRCGGEGGKCRSADSNGRYGQCGFGNC